MKVTIKNFEVEMEIKNNGIELEVFEPNGTNRLGDLIITKTELIWCPGKTRRENGQNIKWPAFIAQMNAAGTAPATKKAAKKATAKKTATT